MSQLAVSRRRLVVAPVQVVGRLERKGWVRRTPDPYGRYPLAMLTDDGWDKVVATAPDHSAEVRRLVLDPLTNAQVRQ